MRVTLLPSEASTISAFPSLPDPSDANRKLVSPAGHKPAALFQLLVQKPENALCGDGIFRGAGF